MSSLNLRPLILCCIALLWLSPRQSEASSICSGCAAALVGTAVAVGAGVVTTVYFVHRSHTSIAGCVTPAAGGLTLSAKDGSSYSLLNAPSEIRPGTRLSLRGHKTKTASGRGFRVDSISRDYGACDR